MSRVVLGSEVNGVTLRPYQVYAVEETLRAFEEGANLVVINSPVGSGKTIISAEICRRLDSRAYVTSPQKSLVVQMHDDPRFHALLPDSKVLLGRDNFKCLRDELAKQGTNLPVIVPSMASCFELTENGSIAKVPDGPLEGTPIPCRFKKWGDGWPKCEYYHEKAVAELAPVAVTTLAYFLVGTVHYDPSDPGARVGWRHGRMSGRRLLIVDEAHGLDGEVVKFLSSAWHDSSYGNPLYDRRWADWVASPEAKAIFNKKDTSTEEEALAIEGLVRTLVPLIAGKDEVTDPRERKFIESLETDLFKLRSVVTDIRAEIPWIVRYQNAEYRRRMIPILQVTPVVSGPHLRRFLWNRTELVVLMSGSILNAKTEVRDLGADHLIGREITLPSEFPPEFSPIIRVPAGRLSTTTKDAEFPKVLAALWRILDFETGRGVVHAQSFENVDRIANVIPDRFRSRLLLHRRYSPITREELIKQFQEEAEPGEVLVSPSVTEGLDLPGDRGDWLAFLKGPFLDYHNDERVARRRALIDGRDWYTRQAIVTTLQGLGRVVRGPTDHARRYILDQAHTDLIARKWYLFPPHVLASIKAGDELLKDPEFRARLYPPETASSEVTHATP